MAQIIFHAFTTRTPTRIPNNCQIIQVRSGVGGKYSHTYSPTTLSKLYGANITYRPACSTHALLCSTPAFRSLPRNRPFHCQFQCLAILRYPTHNPQTPPSSKSTRDWRSSVRGRFRGDESATKSARYEMIDF